MTQEAVQQDKPYEESLLWDHVISGLAVSLVSIFIGCVMGFQLRSVYGGLIVGAVPLYILGFCWGCKVTYKLCMDDHPGRDSWDYQLKDGVVPALAGGLFWWIIGAIYLLWKFVKWVHKPMRELLAIVRS